jgi:hypothetical protein
MFAAAVVILVAILVGVVGQRFASQSDETARYAAQVQQLQGALQLAADPDTNRAVLHNSAGDASAVLLSGDNAAAVMPMKLAPNDTAKQVYVVWGTSGNGPNPIPLALFDVTPGSPEIRPLAWSPAAHAHSGFAISLEPGRSAPDAPTNPIAAGQVAKG